MEKNDSIWRVLLWAVLAVVVLCTVFGRLMDYVEPPIDVQQGTGQGVSR